MSGVPQLTQYQQGITNVSAAGLNTFEQTCDSVPELRAFTGTQGMQVYMRGYSTPNDGGQGPFYWNATGTGPDDGGITTIVPFGSVQGCWTRIGLAGETVQSLTIGASGALLFASNIQEEIIVNATNGDWYLGPVSQSVTTVGFFMGGTLVPATDNTFNCGQSGNRWSSVWAVNGTIQTSDVRLKDDIQDLPEALPIVLAIRPVTFKWKSGGLDKDCSTPEVRTHWGFDASNVKETFAATGRDFGGYLVDKNGIEHLRPAELIPVLCKALQEEHERISALEQGIVVLQDALNKLAPKS